MNIKDILLSAGGTVWDKKGHRIYISKLWKDLLNAHIEYYNTGNLKYFELDGDKWSNCQAKKLMASLNYAYYDVDHERWVGLGDYEKLFNDLDMLANRVKMLSN